MDDTKKVKKFMKMLEQLWLTQPQLRFGQMLIDNNIIGDDTLVYTRDNEEFEKKILEKIEAALKIKLVR